MLEISWGEKNKAVVTFICFTEYLGALAVDQGPFLLDAIDTEQRYFFSLLAIFFIFREKKLKYIFLMQDCALWAGSLALCEIGTLIVDPIFVGANGDKIQSHSSQKARGSLFWGEKKGNFFNKRPQSLFLRKQGVLLKIILLVRTFSPFEMV